MFIAPSQKAGIQGVGLEVKVMSHDAVDWIFIGRVFAAANGEQVTAELLIETQIESSKSSPVFLAKLLDWMKTIHKDHQAIKTATGSHGEYHGSN